MMSTNFGMLGGFGEGGGLGGDGGGFGGGGTGGRIGVPPVFQANQIRNSNPTKSTSANHSGIRLPPFQAPSWPSPSWPHVCEANKAVQEGVEAALGDRPTARLFSERPRVFPPASAPRDTPHPWAGTSPRTPPRTAPRRTTPTAGPPRPQP